MEHYAPSSEGHAKTVINLCRPLIERKSLQILDACTTVLLALHRSLLDKTENQKAVLILMEGLSLEAIVLPAESISLGACYRTLARLCLETITDVLEWVPDRNSGDKTKVPLAKDIKSVVEKNGALHKIPEAMLTVHGVRVANAVCVGHFEDACDAITEMLLSDIDPDTGTTILRPSLHWLVLCAAQMSIDKVDNPARGFDTKGMNILMERLVELTILPNHPYPLDRVAHVRESLVRGLAHAFVVENTRKASKKTRPQTVYTDELFEGITTSNMHLHSVDTQERFVQHLLDF